MQAMPVLCILSISASGSMRERSFILRLLRLGLDRSVLLHRALIPVRMQASSVFGSQRPQQ